MQNRLAAGDRQPPSRQTCVRVEGLFEAGHIDQRVAAAEHRRRRRRPSLDAARAPTPRPSSTAPDDRPGPIVSGCGRFAAARLVERAARREYAAGFRRRGRRHLPGDRGKAAAARGRRERRARGEQPLAVRVAGALQHAIYLAELDQLAGIHHRDVIAEPANDAEIVADEQETDAFLASEARQQAQDLRLDSDVERGRRFVEDQERGSASQCRGDQRALLHPARELMREGAGDFSRAIDPHLAQRDFGAAERFGQRQSEMLHHRFGDLPANAERRVERRERILKHRADPSSEDPPALRRGESRR